MQNEHMLEIINEYMNAYNNMDVQGMLSCLHLDIVFHNVQNGQYNLPVNGKEEFEALATQALGLFKSRKQTIRKINYSDNGVKVDIDYEGVLAVDMEGFGRAGETKGIKGRSEFVFKDGKIQTLSDHI